MKKFIIGLILGISISAIAADITLSIVIPDKEVAGVIAAFEALQGCRISIESAITNTPLNTTYSKIDYIFPKKNSGETTKEFGKRAIVVHSSALVKLHKTILRDSARREAINTAVSSIPDVNVPSEILK